MSRNLARDIANPAFFSAGHGMAQTPNFGQKNAKKALLNAVFKTFNGIPIHFKTFKITFSKAQKAQKLNFQI